MSTLTLATSYLTTSNLPWFMDLTFQVPMQYCSLQHRTLLLSPVISTTGYWFCFGSIPPFFLELFLQWSPVAYWACIALESSFFSILSFCLFICSWGSQGKNTEVSYHFPLQRIFPTQRSNHASCIGGQFLYNWATREAFISPVPFPF